MSYVLGRMDTSHRPPPPYDPDRLDGRDTALITSLLPHLTAVCERYFHVRTEGLDHVAPGPALLVGNHNNGMLGPEVGCTLTALWNRHGPEAPLFALAHDFAMRRLPRFGRFIQRFGGIAATPHNARRALELGARVLVYPGSELEACRPTSRRDEIVFAHRNGFVRVAQETGVPIVPVVAQGAHRSAYIFTDGEAIARALQLGKWARIHRFPVALALPWGLALGPFAPYFPLPLPVKLRFLPPIHVPKAESPSAAAERVRAAMQAAMNDLAR